MKKILLCLLIVAFTKINSQNLILTKAANEPLIGDTSKAYIVDTTAYASGLNVALTGSNTVWTYTNLIATSNGLTSYYVDPATVPSSTNYPGCSVVQKQGTLNTFFKSVPSPSTQLEFMGVSSSSLNMNFTNTAVYARYPFTFGDVVTDNFSGSFTFSISGTASGNATITADGTGTLNLPNDTLTNVLRVKSSQTTNFTSGFIPVGSIKLTNYAFYHASQKYPVFTIQYQTLSITGQASSVTAVVSGNKNNFVVGVKENVVRELNATIYPNPAGNNLTINLDPLAGAQETKIYNQLGEVVYKGSFKNEIALTTLQSGIYILEVKAEKGILRKKFIKE